MPQSGAQNYAINQMAQRTAGRTCAVVPNRATGSAQEQGLALRPDAPRDGMADGGLKVRPPGEGCGTSPSGPAPSGGDEAHPQAPSGPLLTFWWAQWPVDFTLQTG